MKSLQQMSQHPVLHDKYSAAYNDIVDGDVDQFDKETNKSHYCKAYCCCHGNLLELFPVRLGASFNKSYGVFHKLTAGFHELHYLIHDYLQR